MNQVRLHCTRGLPALIRQGRFAIVLKRGTRIAHHHSEVESRRYDGRGGIGDSGGDLLTVGDVGYSAGDWTLVAGGVQK